MTQKTNPRRNRIIIASKEEASALLTSQWKKEFKFVISFGAPGDELPDNLYELNRDVCRIEVFDFPSMDHNNPYAPQPTDVERIIEFGEKALPTGELILCHCAAGISRSSAAAFILHCMDLGPGHEQEAARRVMASRDIAWPNLRIVTFADELLERDGAMIDAFKWRFDTDPRL